MLIFYRNKKSGKTYTVVGDAIKTIDNKDVGRVVVYKSMNGHTMYATNKSDFDKEFEMRQW